MATVQPNAQHAFQVIQIPQSQPQPNAPAPNVLVQQAVLQPQPQPQVAQQQFQVAVSEAAVPGQQILFTAPDGQRAMVTAQEHLQPGSVIHVQCPYRQQPVNQQQPAQQNLQPLLPPPAVSAQEADRRASSNAWILYALSWFAFCCCSPFCGMLMWGGLAAWYFCKPRQQREQMPRQRTAAQVAAATAGVGCCFGIICVMGFLGLMAACGQDMNRCPQFKHPGHMPDWHHHHHHDYHPANHSNHSDMEYARPQWAHVNNFDVDRAVPKPLQLVPVDKRFLAPTPKPFLAPPPPPKLPVATELTQSASDAPIVTNRMEAKIVINKEALKEKWADMKSHTKERWARVKAFVKNFHDDDWSMKKLKDELSRIVHHQSAEGAVAVV